MAWSERGVPRSGNRSPRWGRPLSRPETGLPRPTNPFSSRNGTFLRGETSRSDGAIVRSGLEMNNSEWETVRSDCPRRGSSAPAGRSRCELDRSDFIRPRSGQVEICSGADYLGSGMATISSGIGGSDSSTVTLNTIGESSNSGGELGLPAWSRICVTSDSVAEVRRGGGGRGADLRLIERLFTSTLDEGS